jgi:hypothetical protein
MKKLKNYISIILKWCKVIGLVVCLCIGIIGTIFLILLGKKPKEYINKKYQDKLDTLLKEKVKDEKIISDFGVDDYNDNGTIKSRKLSRKNSRRKNK